MPIHKINRFELLMILTPTCFEGLITISKKANYKNIENQKLTINIMKKKFNFIKEYLGPLWNKYNINALF
jgi:hypothetical protein